MKVAVLKEFLALKYAFVFEGFTIIKPSIDNRKSFASGLFLGTVLVYDLIKNKPLYRYTYTATNSEEISYRQSKTSFLNEKPITVINNDFRSNIKSGLYKKTLKHFKFN